MTKDTISDLYLETVDTYLTMTMSIRVSKVVVDHNQYTVSTPS